MTKTEGFFGCSKIGNRLTDDIAIDDKKLRAVRVEWIKKNLNLVRKWLGQLW